MSFQQALSGLNAASRTLEIIGNNVANASTVGFKQSAASFADVFASSLSGGSASQIGIGTQLNQVSQQFTQGNITVTNNPLDIAINGNGFFRVRNEAGSDFYTRNGQFQMNDQGYIVNANGSFLTGYPANAEGVLSTAVDRLQIPFNTGNPSATSEVSIGLNLDSGAQVKDFPPGSGTPVTPATFDVTNQQTYNSTTSVQVFDSLGNARVFQTYYVKTSNTTWDVYATMNGHPITSQDPAVFAPIASLTFDGTGRDPAITMTGWEDADRDIPDLDRAGNAIGALPMDFVMRFNNPTHFSGGFSVNELRQDGYPRGELAGFGVGPDGVILGRYTNGATMVLGQVELATFRNPNGLQMAGNNMWVATAASGDPTPNLPGQGNAGVLQASTVEESNVDLTAELVKMITAQRFYQANAQTIKTQDQAMQTLVNLR